MASFNDYEYVFTPLKVGRQVLKNRIIFSPMVSDYTTANGEPTQGYIDFVEEQAFQGTLSAHVDGGVPNIVLQTDEVDADTLGELFYFFELSCGISAYMLGVNPFNQPGVEFYKKNMFHLLGKPGY